MPHSFFLQRFGLSAHSQCHTWTGRCMQKSETDEWLMAQVARGRRECVEPLLRRHAGPMLSFLRRLVGDIHRSEELFQEVFLAVWVKRTQYEAGRAFRPWL